VISLLNSSVVCIPLDWSASASRRKACSKVKTCQKEESCSVITRQARPYTYQSKQPRGCSYACTPQLKDQVGNSFHWHFWSTALPLRYPSVPAKHLPHITQPSATSRRSRTQPSATSRRAREVYQSCYRSFYHVFDWTIPGKTNQRLPCSAMMNLGQKESCFLAATQTFLSVKSLVLHSDLTQGIAG